MKKIELYKQILLSVTNQEQFLLENSGLPGPRSNLELLYAFAEISDLQKVEEILNRKYEVTPVNSPEEFLFFCAVAACGKHILNNSDHLIPVLKGMASDERWRIRESVAMALQYIGKFNFDKLKKVTYNWENGSCYEQRALAAGLCEPPILTGSEIKFHTLKTLENITIQFSKNPDKKSPSYKTLEKALCYCWSVGIAAEPIAGKEIFERLITINDKSIRKIMKENLNKNRVQKMDQLWANKLLLELTKF